MHKTVRVYGCETLSYDTIIKYLHTQRKKIFSGFAIKNIILAFKPVSGICNIWPLRVFNSKGYPDNSQTAAIVNLI
jgi:hypothetical protein